MNKVILQGRFVKTPILRYSTGAEPLPIASFTLAVNRKKKDEADFINCTCFGKTAETISKYFSKGKPILISGRLQTGSYEKEGQKHYTTEVIVDDFDFIGSKTEYSAPATNKADESAADFADIQTIDENDELPF